MMTLSSVYPQASSVVDGRLVIGGCDAAELAREFGTPAYGVGLIVLDGSDAQKLDELGVRGQRCLIRVVPGVDVDTHTGIQTGGTTSKFGLLPDEAAALIAVPPQSVDIVGLHCHLGSQLFD